MQGDILWMLEGLPIIVFYVNLIMPLKVFIKKKKIPHICMLASIPITPILQLMNRWCPLTPPTKEKNLQKLRAWNMCYLYNYIWTLLPYRGISTSSIYTDIFINCETSAPSVHTPCWVIAFLTQKVEVLNGVDKYPFPAIPDWLCSSSTEYTVWREGKWNL